MGLYNFQDQFVPYILDGTKTHTIRMPRKYPDRLGRMMHLYTGLRRSKDEARKLFSAPCIRIDLVRLDKRGIWLNGVPLSERERDELAWRDGFRPSGSTLHNPGESFPMMASFWRESDLPLQAYMYTWDWERRR